MREHVRSENAQAGEEPGVLLERARSGDTKALEAMLRSLQPQIYRFGMKMCRHPEDAEDVLQDTMLTLARTFRDFRGASSLSTWLYSITRSFCIKKRRKGKYDPASEESLEHLDAETSGALASSAEGPLARAQSKQFWQQLSAAIESLEPSRREVLVLRDIEGLSSDEVSEVVGISVAAVKSRLHRARAELREIMAPEADKPARPGCPDIRNIFSQFLEGDLPAEVCQTMEAHVAGCPMCATECDGLKATLNTCRSAPCDLPSAECQTKMDKALRDAIANLDS